MGLFNRTARREPRAPVPEFRDPTAATASLRWHGKGMAQVPEWDAARAIRFGYHANVVAYRCVAIIADTIASTPFRAGVALPESPNVAADHNPQARLAQLLGPPPGGPAPNLSARKLWAWTVAQRLVTGRNGWEIETTQGRGQGPVVALWPLTAANLHAVPSKSGAAWFTGFRYGRPDDLRNLNPDQVHYGWTGAADDFRQPFSPLQAARYAASVALAQDQYQYAFLKNNAVPANVIGVQAFPDADSFEAFKRQWSSTYRGPQNAGKTHFVEIDLEDSPDAKMSEALFVQTIGATAEEAKLPEVYMQALQQIAIAFGVPWSKLDASGRTFDNASEEDRTFYHQTVLPLATDLADEVNMGLAPRLGAEVGWFDFSGVAALKPHPVAAPSEIPALVQLNVVSPDEARQWLGLSGPAPTPLEVPSAPDPVERGADGDRRRPGGETGRARGGEGRPAEGVPTEDRREAVAEARATVDQEARRGAIWRSTDLIITGQERRFERAFAKLFRRQQASVISRLEGNARSKRWAALSEARAGLDEVRAGADNLFDPAFWGPETEDVAVDLFEQLSEGAFARVSSHFGVSFDLEAEFAQTFIRSRANQLAGQVTQTTYRAIVAALAEGVGAGEAIPDLASRIRSVFADAAGNRATVIARTEVISGHNAAAVAAASSLPADVVAGQQWIATRDGRTRETHAAADGQIVAVGQPFTVAGIAGAYPGDPSLPAKETVQCRCTVAFLTPDEFEAEASAYAQASAAQPVPVARAKAALALVVPGHFDETRFRGLLEAA